MYSTTKSAFSLIEVMTAVVIVGVLATIAVPTFKAYKDKAKLAESYEHVELLAKGARAYYNTAYWTRGATGMSKTGCTVPAAWTSNFPSSQYKTILNWDDEPVSFRALNFMPADPVYFRYIIWTDGACGHGPNDISLGWVGSAIDFDEAGGNSHVQKWDLCSNAQNEMFVCGKHHRTTIHY